ncbi:hypothetical protein KVR01_008104 [Diaporthe batatas]|uniref:uncharacterized protein n=1 Tax=Diaporthe batatas TaxID=748121 RepID=UPI001D03A8B6|nr:uncharacterized protein KVR01_008104 [Diaporthe batatas]KAG8162339.1 hypothetical protein KVR01_008104 [Diaporthe batatas]
MAKYQMAVAQTSPRTLVPICYLVDVLPVEVRLKIYKYYCEGSQVEASLAKNGDDPVEQTGSLVLKSSEHLNLLHTCRTIYNEALETYWSATLLQLNHPPRKMPGNTRAWAEVKLKIDTYSHRLCAALPEAARANVKDVRGMVLPALKSVWLQNNPGQDASALLATFKKLETCEMTQTLTHPIDGLVRHYPGLEDLEDENSEDEHSEDEHSEEENRKDENLEDEDHEDPKDESYSRFKVTVISPSEFLNERYGLTNFDGIVFILKGKDKHVVGIIPPIKASVFYNFSTGIAFQDMTKEMDDEEAYKKILDIEE